MLPIYIFSMVLGGGFLVIAILGDVLGDASDVDTGVDLDVGADADVDFGGDVDFDGDADLGVDAEGDGTHATKIFSLRTAVYGLFGFGAVGTALTTLGAGGAASTFGFAMVGGALCAALITVIFNWLAATDSGSRPGDEAFVGLPGRVTLPLSAGSPGSVAVERGGRRVTLRALPHGSGEGDAEEWRSVVVVEMKDGIARVSPVADELTTRSEHEQG